MLRHEDWPLTGRDEEVRLVEQVVLSGGPGLLLAGAAGVGKTRLLRTVLSRLTTAGIAAEWVSATGAAASIPFGAVSRLLPARLPGGGDHASRYAAVVREFATRCTERPVVIGVDDAHLLDDASAGLLHQLAVHGLATIVATVRSGEPLTDALTALWTGAGRRLEMRPLPSPAVDELLDRAVPGPLDAISRRRLGRLAAGNPLLLRELLADAMETGALRAEGGFWRWHGTTSGSPRLAELVAARLHALAPATRQVLEVVACGEPLPLALLECLADPAAVEAAERSGMAIAERSGARTAVRLVHPLYGEALRASMPASRSRAVFGRLADALATTPLRRSGDALLAGVWQLRAGAVRRPDVMLRAAQQAIARFDIDLAERLARAARDTAPSWEADWLLARVLQYQARSQEALDTLPAAPAADSSRLAAWTITRAGLLYWGLDRIEEAHETMHRVAPDTPGQDLVAAVRSWILFYDGQCRAALEVGSAVLDRPDIGPRARAWATMSAAAAAGMLGDLDRAVALVDRSRAAVDDSGPDLWGDAQIGWGLCYALRGAGLLHRAAQVAGTGYRAAVDGDARGMAGVWAGFHGVVAKAQGRLDVAETSLLEAIALVGEHDQYRLIRTFMAELAGVRALRGDLAEARRWLAEADARHRRANRFFHPWVESNRAWVQAAGGDTTAAIRTALHAADLARQTEQPTMEAVALYDCARLGAADRVRDRLAGLADRIGGAASIFSDAATALALGDAAGLHRAAERFTETGHLSLAAEATQAAARPLTTGGTVPRYAAQWPPQPVERPGASVVDGPERLTRRERDVALLAVSLPSREIAERLGLSVHTVNNNLARVYHKFGVRNRRELAMILGPHLAEPPPVRARSTGPTTGRAGIVTWPVPNHPDP
jgi:DNA-binding CsgD family transcriptional regulator/tetratricopeptide (TPR) repeat protein